MYHTIRKTHHFIILKLDKVTKNINIWIKAIVLFYNFAILMDFDRTITSKDSLGSWSVLENPKFMCENFRTELYI